MAANEYTEDYDYCDISHTYSSDIWFKEFFSSDIVDYKLLLQNIITMDDPDIKIFLSDILDIEDFDYHLFYSDLFNNTSNYNSSQLATLKDLVNRVRNTDTFDITDISEPDTFDYSTIGLVIGISDNIVNIVGLYDVAFGEMIEILTGVESAMGMVLNIEENKVSAIIFSSDINIKPGQEVVRTCVLMSVPTGDNLLGRIVDPLGNPLDSLGIIIPTGHRFMDSIAPSIISRKSVNTPLETGLKLLIVWFLLDMVNVS